MIDRLLFGVTVLFARAKQTLRKHNTAHRRWRLLGGARLLSDRTYAVGSVLWGSTPHPAIGRRPLDPERGEEIAGFSNRRLCRLKQREHGFFWQLRKSYLI